MRLKQNRIAEKANRKNLLLLYYLRWIAIFGQILTILVVIYAFQIPLPVKYMTAVILGLLALNFIAYYRYRLNKNISDRELFLWLILDVIALTAQFYFSGGGMNPFIGLFILQVIIAATILRRQHTWMLVILTLSCYIFLSFFNIEIPHFHHYHIGEFFNLHVHGMLISYAISSILIAYFIMQMSQNLKDRDQLLSRIKERQIIEENILRLGMLAASAAHELGTPLATSVLLTEEYLQEAKNPDEAKRAETLRGQLMKCKSIISQIAQEAGAMRAESGHEQKLDSFLQEIAERWKQAHPKINFIFERKGNLPVPVIIAEYALEQAITNLLNNAAEASPNYVIMQTEWTKEKLLLSIQDKGAGINPEIINALGRLGKTTKPDGLGMGLYLTNAIITRLDGSLELKNNGSGTTAEITLPLARLAI